MATIRISRVVRFVLVGRWEIAWMLVLDQSRADVGMPVVKVVVSGLRHFWARYALGRFE